MIPANEPTIIPDKKNVELNISSEKVYAVAIIFIVVLVFGGVLIISANQKVKLDSQSPSPSANNLDPNLGKQAITPAIKPSVQGASINNPQGPVGPAKPSKKPSPSPSQSPSPSPSPTPTSTPSPTPSSSSSSSPTPSDSPSPTPTPTDSPAPTPSSS